MVKDCMGCGTDGSPEQTVALSPYDYQAGTICCIQDGRGMEVSVSSSPSTLIPGTMARALLTAESRVALGCSSIESRSIL
jgi:hypothetical protein